MILGARARRPARVPSGGLGRWSWALFDWANSAYATIIVTFVFPAYFQLQVVGDPVAGQALWGYGLAASALIIALAAPLLGAIADEGGRRKPWIFGFMLACATGSALLWFVEPSMGWTAFALACVVLADIGFDFSVIFANAMLPEIVQRERLGRLSGLAWGMGYAGGLAALGLVLSVFIRPAEPPFGLDAGMAEHVRIGGPLVGLWLILFSLPLFLFTPDRPLAMPLSRAVRRGLRRMLSNLAELPKARAAALFLLAHMLYADGLTAVFAFGGVYAAGVFGLTLSEILLFGIALNAAAGVGALVFAWIDDWLGSKRTIIVALLGLIAASILAVLATDRLGLWIAGLALGIFVGPAQASSRALMARLADPDKRAAYFALFALSGQATAFLGPAAVAALTQMSGSQRAGIGAIVALFVLGLLLILMVREPGRSGPAANTGEREISRP